MSLSDLKDVTKVLVAIFGTKWGRRVGLLFAALAVLTFAGGKVVQLGGYGKTLYSYLSAFVSAPPSASTATRMAQATGPVAPAPAASPPSAPPQTGVTHPQVTISDSNLNTPLGHNFEVGRGVDPVINITGTTMKAGKDNFHFDGAPAQ